MFSSFTFLERCPQDFNASTVMQAPLFTYDGMEYLMVGADKSHDNVTSTPMSFEINRTDDIVQLRSRLLRPMPLKGLLVVRLAVATEPFTGLNVTISEDDTQVTFETTEGAVPIPFGNHENEFKQSFDQMITTVFESSAIEHFLHKTTEEPATSIIFSKEETAWIAEIDAKCAGRYTPKVLERLRIQSLPIFYQYQPVDRMTRRIANHFQAKP